MFAHESLLIVIVGVLIAHLISFAVLVIYKLWSPDEDIKRDIDGRSDPTPDEPKTSNANSDKPKYYVGGSWGRGGGFDPND